jgi:hypothetical protein
MPSLHVDVRDDEIIVTQSRVQTVGEMTPTARVSAGYALAVIVHEAPDLTPGLRPV